MSDEGTALAEAAYAEMKTAEEDDEVVGKCQICGDPILEQESRVVDDDGDPTCWDCHEKGLDSMMEAMVEDASTDLERQVTELKAVNAEQLDRLTTLMLKLQSHEDKERILEVELKQLRENLQNALTELSELQQREKQCRCALRNL